MTADDAAEFDDCAARVCSGMALLISLADGEDPGDPLVGATWDSHARDVALSVRPALDRLQEIVRLSKEQP